MTLSQLLCVPTVRTEKSGSVFGVAQRFRRRHLHRLLDEHQLALEVAGEEQSRRGRQCDRLPAIVAGRYIVVASADSSGRLCERTISHADIPATNAPAVSSDAATT